MLSLTFAAVAALALDVLAVICVFAVGFYFAKRGYELRQRNAFAAINRALTILTIDEVERALKAPDKIVGLLQAGTAKGRKFQGDHAACEAEFKT
jgi:hypothetical protein